MNTKQVNAALKILNELAISGLYLTQVKENVSFILNGDYDATVKQLNDKYGVGMKAPSEWVNGFVWSMPGAEVTVYRHNNSDTPIVSMELK